MAPTRAPVALNGILRTRQKLLVLFGALFTIVGLAALTSELWRTFTGIQDHFRWTWIGVALGISGIGLVIIQTLNPVKVIEIAYRLWMTRYPGGRRATDPPPDSAPPPIPPELWPLLPPRIRAHEIAKADKAAADDGPKHLDGA
jgi:hypothetical protein